MSARLRCIFPALVSLALAAGCDSGPAVGTVNGEVTLDGQPLAEGRVQFTPLDGKGQTAGDMIKDGKFKLEVPVATMKVEIYASKVIGQRKLYDTPTSPTVPVSVDIVPAKYNTNSTFVLEVKRGQQDAKYAVTSK